MSGGVQLMGNLSLPYNRLVIVGFALAVLVGVWFLIEKTRLGFEQARLERGAHAGEAELLQGLFDFHHAHGHTVAPGGLVTTTAA